MMAGWPKLRALFRIVGPAGVAVLAVIYWPEIRDAFWRALEVGPAFFWLIPLFWLWNHIATLGWKDLIQVIDKTKPPSIWKLSLIRLEAQSVNLVLPFAIGTPVVKTSLLARGRGAVAASAASVTLDTMASAVAGFLFAVVALGAHSALLTSGAASVWLMATATLGILSLLYFTPKIASHLSTLRWIRDDSPTGQTLSHLANSGPALNRSLIICISSHLVERILMAIEIWIIAYGLGFELDLSQTAFISALMTSFTLIFFFIPGQAGAAEGSLALAFSLLGLPLTAGLGTGLVRRARQLIVYGAGLVLLFVRKTKNDSSKWNEGCEDNANSLPSAS